MQQINLESWSTDISGGVCILQVVFYGEEGVDAGGVRKVKLACYED